MYVTLLEGGLGGALGLDGGWLFLPIRPQQYWSCFSEVILDRAISEIFFHNSYLHISHRCFLHSRGKKERRKEEEKERREGDRIRAYPEC